MSIKSIRTYQDGSKQIREECEIVILNPTKLLEDVFDNLDRINASHEYWETDATAKVTAKWLLRPEFVNNRRGAGGSVLSLNATTKATYFTDNLGISSVPSDPNKMNKTTGTLAGARVLISDINGIDNVESTVSQLTLETALTNYDNNQGDIETRFDNLPTNIAIETLNGQYNQPQTSAIPIVGQTLNGILNSTATQSDGGNIKFQDEKYHRIINSDVNIDANIDGTNCVYILRDLCNGVQLDLIERYLEMNLNPDQILTTTEITFINQTGNVVKLGTSQNIYKVGETRYDIQPDESVTLLPHRLLDSGDYIYSIKSSNKQVPTQLTSSVTELNNGTVNITDTQGNQVQAIRAVNELTTKSTSPDATADFIPIYENSTGIIKKINKQTLVQNEVLYSNGALTGTVPVGKELGIDTATGTFYYKNASGNWQAQPVGTTVNLIDNADGTLTINAGLGGTQQAIRPINELTETGVGLSPADKFVINDLSDSTTNQQSSFIHRIDKFVNEPINSIGSGQTTAGTVPVTGIATQIIPNTLATADGQVIPVDRYLDFDGGSWTANLTMPVPQYDGQTFIVRHDATFDTILNTTRTSLVSPLTLKAGNTFTGQKHLEFVAIADLWHLRTPLATNKLEVFDTRSVNGTPESYSAGFYEELKTSSVIGLSAVTPAPSPFANLRTTRQYGTGADFSGGVARQEATLDDGRTYYRLSTSATTWGSWINNSPVQGRRSSIGTANTNTTIISGDLQFRYSSNTTGGNLEVSSVTATALPIHWFADERFDNTYPTRFGDTSVSAPVSGTWLALPSGGAGNNEMLKYDIFCSSSSYNVKIFNWTDTIIHISVTRLT
ncbi:MAG: hypothetical protein ACRCZ2_10100 [Fusobacteriaceae bacterium]